MSIEAMISVEGASARGKLSQRKVGLNVGAQPNYARRMGTLYYGDNLEILWRYVKDETVDLVYLAPPFNSAQNYNAIFHERDGTDAASQIQACQRRERMILARSCRIPLSGWGNTKPIRTTHRRIAQLKPWRRVWFSAKSCGGNS